MGLSEPTQNATGWLGHSFEETQSKSTPAITIGRSGASSVRILASSLWIARISFARASRFASSLGETSLSAIPNVVTLSLLVENTSMVSTAVSTSASSSGRARVIQTYSASTRHGLSFFCK